MSKDIYLISKDIFLISNTLANLYAFGFLYHTSLLLLNDLYFLTRWDVIITVNDYFFLFEYYIT